MKRLKSRWWCLLAAILVSLYSTTPSQNTVTFNGTAATVTASTATSITTSVPAGATSVTIAVPPRGPTRFSWIPRAWFTVSRI